MQNSFSLGFLNSLVPPVRSARCTNAGYKTPAAGVGNILIIHTWSACQSCFLSFHTSTPALSLCGNWNVPSRLPCAQSLHSAFRAQAADANDQGCTSLQQKTRLVRNEKMKHWSLDIFLSCPAAGYFSNFSSFLRYTNSTVCCWFLLAKILARDHFWLKD